MSMKEKCAEGDFELELLMVFEEESQTRKQKDLYDELIQQPTLGKQESLNYDYVPNLEVLPCPTFETRTSSEFTLQLNMSTSLENPSPPVTKCNCSKTKCIKNYCDCFKAGRACGDSCSCTDCHNNQNFFLLPKKNSAGYGCKCQKSHCEKKYCECHSAGRKCTEECQCIECHNMEIGEKIKGRVTHKKVKRHIEE